MLNRLLIVLAAVLAALLSIDTFAAFGRTAGTFGVSSTTGSAQYTIPIWMPPGVNGLQPKLSLTYDSQLGYGLMGPGWSISGLSNVFACIGSRHLVLCGGRHAGG